MTWLVPYIRILSEPGLHLWLLCRFWLLCIYGWKFEIWRGKTCGTLRHKLYSVWASATLGSLHHPSPAICVLAFNSLVCSSSRVFAETGLSLRALFCKYSVAIEQRLHGNSKHFDHIPQMWIFHCFICYPLFLSPSHKTYTTIGHHQKRV